MDFGDEDEDDEKVKISFYVILFTYLFILQKSVISLSPPFNLCFAV